MPFGQLVIGPPGSGKTTYCEAMRRHLAARGRDVAVVNLDPANDSPPYECAVDIARLITVDDAAAEYALGPNGGLVYCFEYLAANVDWLVEQLRPLGSKYVLFDCPGQIELYTHHEAVRAVTDALARELDFRLVALHLLDAHHCAEVSKYVSGLVVSLSAMLQLELPHVNVLSKVDLVEAAGPLALPLSYYADCADLSRLLPFCEASPAFSKKHAALTSRLCELVDDFALLHFIPCCATDDETLAAVLRDADKSCGYAFGALERNNAGLFATAAGVVGSDYDRVAAVADRYTGLGLDGSDADALARHYRDRLYGEGGEEGEEAEEEAGDEGWVDGDAHAASERAASDGAARDDRRRADGERATADGRARAGAEATQRVAEGGAVLRAGQGTAASARGTRHAQDSAACTAARAHPDDEGDGGLGGGRDARTASDGASCFVPLGGSRRRAA